MGTSALIDRAILKHNSASQSIDLGDSKDSVLRTLSSVQAGVAAKNLKQPDKYIKSGIKVEIYYFRTGRQPDGLTTDDEFTPYLFNDGKLVAIGWRTIGGPKSFGKMRQPAPVTNVTVENHNSTIVY